MKLPCLRCLLFAGLALPGTVGIAQEFDERFSDWPTETTIKGTLVVNAGADESSLVESLRLSRRPGTIGLLMDSETPNEKVAAWEAAFNADADRTFTMGLLDTSHAQIKSFADKHTILVMHATLPLEWNEATTRQISETLTQFLRKDGVLIVSGSIAQWAGQYRLTGRPGLNLALNGVVTDSDSDSLLNTLKAKPRTVGVVLKHGTAMVLSGRKVRVIGDSSLELILPAGKFLPVRKESIVAINNRRRIRPTEVLFDWTEWRRDSIERTLPQFPSLKPSTPHVPNGRLVIVGGGGMPDGLMTDFVKWAGGVDQAKLVYIPCSEEESVSPRQSIVRLWNRMGVKQATFLHTKDRNKAHTDDEFLSPLKDATGVWFGGGRQWNLADSWYGTQGHQLMKQVLKNGGVIGGSSAGASIQARYLARATPIENFRIMAPGYERGGLGFLQGVAVDQHFSQRGRQKDMTQLVNRYPQLLGIGIDESTAIVVTKSRAEIVGDGRVSFYDRSTKSADDSPDHVFGKAKDVYDLAERKFIQQD